MPGHPLKPIWNIRSVSFRRNGHKKQTRMCYICFRLSVKKLITYCTEQLNNPVMLKIWFKSISRCKSHLIFLCVREIFTHPVYNTFCTELHEKIVAWLEERPLMHLLGMQSSSNSYPVPSGFHTIKIWTCTICCDLCLLSQVSTGHPSLDIVRVQTEVMRRRYGVVVRPLVDCKVT